MLLHLRTGVLCFLVVVLCNSTFLRLLLLVGLFLFFRVVRMFALLFLFVMGMGMRRICLCLRGLFLVFRMGRVYRLLSSVWLFWLVV